MKIGIPDDYADIVRGLACYKLLADHETKIWNDAVRDAETLEIRFRDLDALVLLRERTVLSANVIRRLPNLKMITINGPHPNIDVESCTANGTLVCAGHGRTSYATAELTWGLILAAVRKIPQQMRQLQEGGWQTELGTTLRGRTLGILGFGKIGRVVAQYGRAFGMRVLVWSRARGLEEARAAGYETCADKTEIFDSADVVTLHVRYVPATHGLVTRADLARMKPTAVIVNTSRSALIESGALAEALAAGRPGSAAVDVYDEEPVLDARDPLVHARNVVCTPHLGYFERDQMESYFRDQFERVLAYAAGVPVDVENPAALRNRKTET